MSSLVFFYNSFPLNKTTNQLFDFLLNQNNFDDDGEQKLSLLELSKLRKKIQSYEKIEFWSLFGILSFSCLYLYVIIK